MNKYKLFMVAVLEIPKQKTDEEELPPKLILEPVTVIAKSEQDAAIKIVIGNKGLDNVDKDRIEVIVRPF